MGPPLKSEPSTHRVASPCRIFRNTLQCPTSCFAAVVIQDSEWSPSNDMFGMSPYYTFLKCHGCSGLAQLVRKRWCKYSIQVHIPTTAQFDLGPSSFNLSPDFHALFIRLRRWTLSHKEIFCCFDAQLSLRPPTLMTRFLWNVVGGNGLMFWKEHPPPSTAIANEICVIGA